MLRPEGGEALTGLCHHVLQTSACPFFWGGTSPCPTTRRGVGGICVNTAATAAPGRAARAAPTPAIPGLGLSQPQQQPDMGLSSRLRCLCRGKRHLLQEAFQPTFSSDSDRVWLELRCFSANSSFFQSQPLCHFLSPQLGQGPESTSMGNQGPNHPLGLERAFLPFSHPCPLKISLMG